MPRVKVRIRAWTGLSGMPPTMKWTATAYRVDTGREITCATHWDRATAIARCRAKLGSRYEVVWVE